MLNVVLLFGFYLSIYGLIIYGLMRGLRGIGVVRSVAVFAAFALFGIGSGLLAALAGRSEGWYIFNILGVPLADEIYHRAMQQLADPHSAIAHFDIPWIQRTPQIAFFTSSVIWMLLGIPAQIIYNLKVRKSTAEGTAARAIKAPVIFLLVAALFLASAGLIFLSQSDRDRFGPSEPWAVRVAEMSTPTPSHAPTIDPPRDTWMLERLDFSPESVTVGHEVMISATIVNLAATASIVNIDIQVDGQTLETNRITILPGENQRILFAVVFPKPGEYTVTIANLSRSVEVVQ